MDDILKIAIQKKGRLHAKSVQLFRDCGIKIPYTGSQLKARASNFPVEFLFLRDDDIPEYVAKKVADVGVLGENVVVEKQKEIEISERLGFSGCKLSLAIPKQDSYTGLAQFNNKRIATSYPNILKGFLEKHGIVAEIEEISGSVEIAPGIGLADAICDIVDTGSTLMMNGLKEVETIFNSEAVLIQNKTLSESRTDILSKLLFRIRALRNAVENKYILLNAPNSAIEQITKILPGMKSPTVLPLAEDGWSSIHAVIEENTFWELIDQLKEVGAEGILVVPIEKMIL